MQFDKMEYLLFLKPNTEDRVGDEGWTKQRVDESGLVEFRTSKAEAVYTFYISQPPNTIQHYQKYPYLFFSVSKRYSEWW